MKVRFAIILTSLFLLLGAFKSVAQEWGLLRYVHSKTNIRAERSTKSEVVGSLKVGQKIKVDFLSNNWFAVFYYNETIRDENNAMGYIFAPLLKPNPPSKKPVYIDNSGSIKYKIVKKEDVSYQGTPRMVYRILLLAKEKPSEKNMKKTANNIWLNGNRGWKEFTIFMYLKGMDTNDMAFAIAEYRPNGLKSFRIQQFALFGTKWSK